MRPRNLIGSLVVFAILAIGALVRIDRLRTQSSQRDARLSASIPWATMEEVPFAPLRSDLAELKLLAGKR